MIIVGSYEAKTRLPALLDKVEKGERVRITRRGVPIAEIIPAGRSDEEDIAQVIEDIRRLRKGVTTGGMSIREMIEEGRRY